jgi:uncharacterized protein DUF4159
MTRKAFALAASVVVLVGASAFAQRQGRGFGGGSNAPIKPNLPYDGRFTFIRLRYGPPIQYQSQRVPWSHDYPEGEENMMKILDEITNIEPRAEQSNILALEDPEIFKYPVTYMCEPGRYFYVSDDAAKNMRAYLHKGGFLIIDDFRYFDWDNFQEQMLRILPDARIVDLDASHPIFHSFFEINSLSEVPNYYDQGPPIFRGIYEDNDPKKRLMVVIGYNTDISEFWEWSGTGFKPVDESNEAFKVGVNFFVYGLTH